MTLKMTNRWQALLLAGMLCLPSGMFTAYADETTSTTPRSSDIENDSDSGESGLDEEPSGGLFVSGSGSWKLASNGKWWFCYPDGTYPVSCWMTINGEKYHFDALGYRETGWIRDGGVWYYLRSDGTLVTSQWVFDKYYVDESGQFIPNRWVKASEGRWWFRRGDGTYPAGCWAEIDGKKYLFDEKGWMVTGWAYAGNDLYYFDANGHIVTNSWVDNKYLGDDGIYIPNTWVSVNGRWWYKYGDGTYPYSTLKVIDGKTYYFDTYGWMKTGWVKLEDGWRYFSAVSGEMLTNRWIQNDYVGADGLWVKS